MSNDELNRERIQQLTAGFIASWEAKKPCTVILTTDGKKYHISDSSYPLPQRYLKAWEEDTRRFDADLSLSGSEIGLRRPEPQ